MTPHKIEDLSVETALKIVKGIRYSTPDFIVRCLAKAGEHDRALSLAVTPSVIEELSYDDKERAKELFIDAIIDDISYSKISHIVDSGLSREEKMELLKKFFERADDGGDYFHVAKAFAILGARDEALKALTLALNKETDKKKWVDYLKDVADCLYRSGFVEDSLELFRKAIDIASELDDKDSKLDDLAKDLALLGEFDLALNVAEQIEEGSSRRRALRYIIKKIYEVGEERYADRAFELAKDLDDFDKKWLVNDIAKYNIQELKSVEGIGDLLKRLEKLVESIKKVNIITRLYHDWR